MVNWILDIFVSISELMMKKRMSSQDEDQESRFRGIIA